MESEQSKIIDFNENDIGGEVELPNFARKYANRKSEIESYEIREGKGFESAEPSYYLRVYTKPLGKEKIKEKLTGLETTIEIKGSRNFGLRKTEGKFTWSSKSELANFLKKHKKTSLNELAGLKVTTAVLEKGDKEYLSFI